MKAKLLGLALTVAALVLVSTVLAKGPPQKVTISGGDLSEELEITGDEATLDALAMMTLEDYRTRRDEAPEVEGLGEGYQITRFYEDPPGRYFPFDELRYYPDPEDGRGYIHYIGIVNGSSEYDGEWFRANSESEAVLKVVIAEGRVADAEREVSARVALLDELRGALDLLVAGQ